MALTKDEVLKVAKLARLKFETEEITKLQSDLNEILTYVDMLNELDTANVDPLISVCEDVNNLRDDKVRDSLSTNLAILNAPEEIDGAIVVPKVVGQ